MESKTIVLDAGRFVPFVVRKIRGVAEEYGEVMDPSLDGLLRVAEELHGIGCVNRAFVVVMMALALGDREFLDDRMGELVTLLATSDIAQGAVASFADEDDSHLDN